LECSAVSRKDGLNRLFLLPENHPTMTESPY
jgi:hypothetical protein